MTDKQSDLTEVSVEGRVPASASSVTLSVSVTPRSGGVLIYSSPDIRSSFMMCKGGVCQITLGYGTGKFYVQKLPGTKDFKIDVQGWS